jgi:hypothetical protein
MSTDQIAVVYGAAVAQFCEHRMGFAVKIEDPKGVLCVQINRQS